MAEPVTSPERMRSILDVSRLLAVTTELDPLLLRIAEAATSLLDCERASIFVHDPTSSELWTKIALHRSEIRIPEAFGVAGNAFATNRMVHVSDPYHDPRFDAEPDRATGFVTRNLLAAPMLDIERRPLGVIEAVNKRGADFTLEDHALLPLLAEQAGVAIQRYRLQVAEIQIAALRHEMELARRVQMALLPAICPCIEGFEIAAWMESSSITGGDLYDAWHLADGRLALLVADASGHGVPAAMLVHEARSLVRAIASPRSHPHEVLARVHEQLLRDLKVGWFVTCALAIVSPDGTLAWSSAGHGPVFIRENSEAKFRLLPPTVPPLGVDREWTTEPPPSLKVEPGGALVILTDGIHETQNPHQEMLGLERVAAALDESPGHSPADWIDHLRTTTRSWRTTSPMRDDQAIVAISHLPTTHSE